MYNIFKCLKYIPKELLLVDNLNLSRNCPTISSNRRVMILQKLTIWTSTNNSVYIYKTTVLHCSSLNRALWFMSRYHKTFIYNKYLTKSYNLTVIITQTFGPAQSEQFQWLVCLSKFKSVRNQQYKYPDWGPCQLVKWRS